MERRMVTITAQIIDPEKKQARVVKTGGEKLPMEVLTAWQFSEYPRDTVVSVTMLLSNNGAAIQDISVMDYTEQAAEETQDTPDIPRENWVGQIYFAPDELRLMRSATSMAEDYGSVNVLVSGPSGYGKSSKAKAWAKQEGMTYLRMDCAKVRDPEEWFGYREAESGSTKFVPTDFTQVIEKGNAVVLMDEFNRVESWLGNTLFPILDDERATTIHGRRITVGPKVIFIATANIGLAYVGTFEFDAALINRMDARFNVGPLPEHVEVEVLRGRIPLPDESYYQIVRTLNALRRTTLDDSVMDISTRSGIKVAKWVKHGMTVRQAFEAVVVTNALDEDRKSVLDIVNSELGVL